VAKVWVIHNLVLSILNNLVSNAIDAMPDGGSIKLSARNEGNDGRFVAFRVEDTGIGIPEQRIPKIFDLLFSTKNSSGFGLWSARRNALRNHGDISVEKSSRGQGTTFKLLLPRADKSR
jgi:signal transduction histidine kinase